MNDEMTTLKDWSLIYLEDQKRGCKTASYDCANDVKLVIQTMERIVRSRDSLFRTELQGKRTVPVATELGNEFFQCIKVDFAGIDKQYPTHRFSPLYTVFKRYAKGLWDCSARLRAYMVDEFNAVVDAIRKAAKDSALKKSILNLQRCERSNAKSMKDMLAGVRALYSKVLVIRLDLYYLSLHGPGLGHHAQEITFEQAQQHRNAFLEYLRTGAFSDHLVGYIWKMEYGFEKGYHVHFAILMDGQAVCKDIVIADLLGEHWKTEITEGTGYAHNYNKDKERYPEPYLGMVSRGDNAKWDVLVRKIRYLTKVDHYVRFQAPKGCKTFDTGGPYKRNA